MEEEILKGIAKIITTDSPNKMKMAELVNGNSQKGQEEIDFGEINDTIRKVIFTNEYIQDAYFIKNKKEILDYVHSQGYTTNLD
jgi:hypothetical protein